LCFVGVFSDSLISLSCDSTDVNTFFDFFPQHFFRGLRFHKSGSPSLHYHLFGHVNSWNTSIYPYPQPNDLTVPEILYPPKPPWLVFYNL